MQKRKSNVKGKSKHRRLDFDVKEATPSKLAEYFAELYSNHMGKELKQSELDDQLFGEHCIFELKSEGNHELKNLTKTLKKAFHKNAWKNALCPGTWDHPVNEMDRKKQLEAATTSYSTSQWKGKAKQFQELEAQNPNGFVEERDGGYDDDGQSRPGKGKGKKGKGKVKPVQDGCPSVMIVTGGALRAVEIFKSLKELHTQTRVHKLFSKHVKVHEQQESLKQPVGVVVGTPARMEKLCELGALGTDRLKYLVFDMGMDVKSMTMMDIHDTRAAVLSLYEKWVHERVLDKKTKLIFLSCNNLNTPAKPKQVKVKKEVKVEKKEEGGEKEGKKGKKEGKKGKK
eukprot:TRINITY_DN368_c0_g1_i1.p1 TRINITY_DN368_c0_g1~~TRINITY_DN368_c0_g1_i1.p1  ORF type:complete len:342 (-),score=129.66 TRINITY_DN368_c0_g1_i1:370-1395(-)